MPSAVAGAPRFRPRLGEARLAAVSDRPHHGQVQTFLPYASFGRSAGALDRARLGKQRVEALQVLRGLTVPGYGWRHHPAVVMWRGYDEALACYGVAICRVWTASGYADTCLDKIVDQLGGVPRRQAELRRSGLLPPWLGRRSLHLSHQSALIRKDPAHYSALFPGVPPDLDYWWPGSALNSETQFG